jgi:hypothetical protein
MKTLTPNQQAAIRSMLRCAAAEIRAYARAERALESIGPVAEAVEGLCRTLHVRQSGRWVPSSAADKALDTLASILRMVGKETTCRFCSGRVFQVIDKRGHTWLYSAAGTRHLEVCSSYRLACQSEMPF